MKDDFLKSHYLVTSIFFICVTISALAFHNSRILYWYFAGLALELIHSYGPYEQRHDKMVDDRDRTITDERFDRRNIR